MIKGIIIFVLSLSFCFLTIAPSQMSNKLAIIISSDKQVYAISEPILINLKIKNISKEKLSIFTRYLEFPNYSLQEGILQIVNSGGERIPCGLPMQPSVPRASEYLILRPGEQKEYIFNIYECSIQKLMPDTYSINYFYYGGDYYYENELKKKVQFPFRETIKSNSLIITIKDNKSIERTQLNEAILIINPPSTPTL
jgi:hypothetical protein